MARVRLIAVTPIGTRRASLMHGDLETLVYPEADVLYGRRVREVRTACGLTLREAASRLDLSVVEFAAIERGALRPAGDPEAFLTDAPWLPPPISNPKGRG